MTKKNIKYKSWPIIGHEKIIVALQNNIKNKFICHAYLFVGPESVGKSETAINFAKTLMCENPEKPCLKCDICRKIDETAYSDFTYINKDKEKIKIDSIRSLQHKISLKSYGGYKFCLINGVDKFTIEAGNAILKLLEEPKGKTVFVLVADSLENILPTIISRCALYRFSLVPEKNIYNWLKDKASNSTSVNNIVRMASGKPGLALRMLNDSDILEEIMETENDIKILLDSNLNKSFSRMGEWAHHENYKIDKLDILIQWLRDLYLYKIGNMDNVVSASNLVNDYKKYSNRISLNKIAGLISNIIKAKESIKNNVNRKLVLENIMLKLKHE